MAFQLVRVSLENAGLPNQYVEVTVSIDTTGLNAALPPGRGGGPDYILLRGFNFSIAGWPGGRVGFPDSSNPALFVVGSPEWLNAIQQPYAALTVCGLPWTSPPSSWLTCSTAIALVFAHQGAPPIDAVEAVTVLDPAGPGETGQFLQVLDPASTAMADQGTIPVHTGRFVTTGNEVAFRLFPAASVPEPHTVLLLLSGLGIVLRRAKRSVPA